MSMELKIYEPSSLDIGLPEIKWNNEELKAAIVAKAEEYESIIYSDDAEREMRQDRANLNRLVNAIDRERKVIKSYYNEPLSYFEMQVKEVIAPLKDVISRIDENLIKFDEMRKKEKEEIAAKLYGENLTKYNHLITFEQSFSKRYYNKTFTTGQMKKEYEALAKKIKTDLETMKSIPEKYQAVALDEYSKAQDVSMAMKRAMDVQAREEELERQGTLAAQNDKKAYVEKKTQEDMPAPENTPRIDSAQPQKVLTAPVQSQGKTYTVRFWATGSYDQIMALSSFLKENNISFGKINQDRKGESK